jgi:multidrug resistance protein
MTTSSTTIQTPRSPSSILSRTTSLSPGLAAEASVAPDTVENGLSSSDVADPKKPENEDQKKPDIEHVFVNDDPRKWSNMRKTFTLILISFASMIAGLAASIQNPAIEDMEARLNATSKQISLSIAVFILIQGIAPLFWSAVTEIKGRKSVYLVSITIFCVGSIVVATSNSIELVIGFRCAQAAGSSAVLAIGAATLADIYEPAERGTKMGTYYISLALATSIGPIFGGILTQLFHWRGPFWFLTIFSGVSVLAFAFAFKDTFRRERSTTYQSVIRHYAKEKEKAMRMRMSKNSSQTAIADVGVKGKQSYGEKKQKSQDATRDVERGVTRDDQSDVVTVDEVKLTLKDVNPFKPLWKVVKRRNNFITLFGSGTPVHLLPSVNLLSYDVT